MREEVCGTCGGARYGEIVSTDTRFEVRPCDCPKFRLEDLKAENISLRAKLDKANTEISRLQKLAYLGDHHFEDLTYKVRMNELLDDMKIARKIVRNMSTEESRAFWETVERNVLAIQDWPEWKRAGINVSQMRNEPRELPGNHKTSDAKTVPANPTYLVPADEIAVLRDVAEMAQAYRDRVGLHSSSVTDRFRLALDRFDKLMKEKV